MNADRLLEALRTAAKDTEVSFTMHRPGTVVTTPAIMLTPGDPFLDTGTHGRIEERWEALVAINPNGPANNVDQLRRLCLLVRKAAGTVGASWDGASGLRRIDGQDSLLVSVNRLRFKHTE